VPRAGRPPAARGVYSFKDVLVPPAEIVLDTSFVVDALITTQPRHEVCLRFLIESRRAQTTVFFNRLLEAELWEAAYAVALRKLHPRRRIAEIRLDGRARRRAKRLRAQVEEEWNAALDALDWNAVEVGEVRSWLPDLMAYGLSSYDAVHAATAAYVDVRPFVTLDYHFSFVPQGWLELYVPTNRLRPCRDRRS
jgi:predicted nucleic acid-binding protein